MKENMGFLIFIIFIVIFFLLLTGGTILKSIKKAKIKAKRAADEKQQKYRDETGRQQLQYHYSGNTTPQEEAKPRAEAEREAKEEEPVEVHTKTATGETIIDRRKERENKKIFDDTDGDYVDFSEE